MRSSHPQDSFRSSSGAGAKEPGAWCPRLVASPGKHSAKRAADLGRTPSRFRLRGTTASLFLTAIFLIATPCAAYEVTCDPADPAANAALLCAGNPCNISGSYNVTSDCVFDFGTRTVRVKNGSTVSAGSGQMRFLSGPFTIEPTGKLRAKGGESAPGGRIELESSGAIEVAGTIDISGNSAGNLTAKGTDITVSGNVLAEGLKTTGGGGDIELEGTGSIMVTGTISATGGSDASGGSIFLSAGHDLAIGKPIDVSGGSGEGGDIILEAGDDVLISRKLTASGTENAGGGGQIDIAAGQDYLTGNLHDGGTLTIEDDLVLMGSSSGTGEDKDCGDGGSVSLSAQGDIVLAAGVSIQANGDDPFCGGGTIIMDSTDMLWDQVTPLDGDVIIVGTGSIEATGGGNEGFGGDIEITAGRDATIAKPIEVDGKSGGGDILIEAGRNAHVSKNLSSDAETAFSSGGKIEVTAGNSVRGTLSIAPQITISANGAFTTTGTNGGDITLGGCDVLVGTRATVWARGANPNRGSIEIAAVRTLELESQVTIDARSNGFISLVHRPGHPPILGAGVTFDPPFSEEETSLRGRFPYCPFCGNSWIDGTEECDDGNSEAGDCCSAACSAEDLGTVTCGQGICLREVEKCSGGLPGPACVPGDPTEPGSETSCDGLDNDCDGEVDERGYPCETGELGVCAEGSEQCEGGSVVCVPNTPSGPEICDGLDNDCNGEVDDACSPPTPTPSPTPVPTPSATPSPDVEGSAKAVAKCASTIGKAARKLAGGRQKVLAKCVTEAFECVQEASAGLSGCLAKAGSKCEKAVRAFLANGAPKFEQTIGKACPLQKRGKLLVAAADLSDAIGFRTCIENTGPGVAALAAIAACVEGKAHCEMNETFGTQAPRAAELFSLLRAAHPPLAAIVKDTGGGQSGILALDCLPPAPGAGGNLGDWPGSGRAAASCQKTLVAAASKFARKRFDALRKCADALLPCLLERDAERRSRCLEKAAGKCARALGSLSKDRANLRASVAKQCGPEKLDLASEVKAGEGLDFGDAELGVCQAVGANPFSDISDVAECLIREHECAVDRLAREALPRLDELLSQVGRAIGSGFCP